MKAELRRSRDQFLLESGVVQLKSIGIVEGTGILPVGFGYEDHLPASTVPRPIFQFREKSARNPFAAMLLVDDQVFDQQKRAALAVQLVANDPHDRADEFVVFDGAQKQVRIPLLKGTERRFHFGDVRRGIPKLAINLRQPGNVLGNHLAYQHVYCPSRKFAVVLTSA